MGGVVNPGSDLLNDLTTPLSWYPRDYCIHYIYNWLLLYYVLLVLGRKRNGSNLKTITCEPRPFLKRYLIN